MLNHRITSYEVDKGDFPEKIFSEIDHKEMIFIPAGAYQRRSGLSPSYSTEQPKQRTISQLDAYYIDRHQVTNRDYQRFVESTSYRIPAGWRLGKFASIEENHPVTGVNWEDVLAYAEWTGKKLPTPGQWEKAAFGPDGLNFPWGSEFHANRCNVLESGIFSTTPVGDYSPGGDSPYKVCDMIGNVWEWVYDWTAPAETRLLMGGAWDTAARFLIAPYFAHVRANPGLRGGNFGFRLVLPIERNSVSE